MKREKCFIVNLHSVIDVITNSSTEIFSSATSNAVEGVKKLIDAILEAGGSDVRHQDLFHDIIRFNCNYCKETDLKELIMDLLVEGEYNPEDDMFKYISKEDYDYICNTVNPPLEYDKYFQINPFTFLRENIHLFDDFIDETEYPNNLLFFPKDTTNESLCKELSKISDLFETDEFYC